MILPSNCYSNPTIPKKKENGSISRSSSCRRCCFRAKNCCAHDSFVYYFSTTISTQTKITPVMRANIFRIVDKIIYVYISRCIATYIMIQVL